MKMFSNYLVQYIRYKDFCITVKIATLDVHDVMGAVVLCECDDLNK